ncbi:MAG TPA: peroxiredoxin, partial [Pyrinomonadaceae bacterium]|nr:peroxiredoxin [Pyrinomonadaceae bacterium]
MKIGENAPDFTLKDGDGHDWKLSEQKGKTVVLLFYPGDNTPVCTKQLCSVRDNWADYAATDALVVGISTDSEASHRDFAEKHDLPLTLLSDANGEVSKLYDASSWIPGRSARAVVVIDKTGIVRHHQVQSLSIFRPKDDEILEAIRQSE